MSATVPTPPGAPGRCVLLKAGFGFFQPDIWIVDADGTPRVWKCWHRRPSLERWLVDGRLARREGMVLRTLAQLDGFPRFLSWPSPVILEMTLLDAEEVPEVKGGGRALSPLYFDRLWGMLTAMHERGISHGDLRRKNLLRAPGDASTPRMVDFTQSLRIAMPAGPVGGFLLRRAIRIDRVTFLKLKRWYLGSLEASEQAELDAVPWYLIVGRFARKRLYRPVRRWLRARSDGG